MEKRPEIPRERAPATYAQLKSLVRRLIAAAGGLEACALVTRVGKSQLALYQHPNEDVHMPLDVALDLMTVAEEVELLRFLAREMGYDLTPAGGEADPAHDIARHALKLSAHTGGFCAELARSSEDGHLDAREIDELSAAARAASNAWNQVIDFLARKRGRP